MTGEAEAKSARRRLLITGGHGFLARAVLQILPEQWTPSLLVRPGRASTPGGTAEFESIEAVAAAGQAPDAVLHLAACIPGAAEDHPDLIPVNVELVEQLVRRFPGARHVLASSVSVFDTGGLPLTMASPVGNVPPYGMSKLRAEEAVRVAASHAAIRFSSIVGPGMRATTFIPRVVEAARAGTIRVVGDGSRLQDYVDVRDAAAMCVRALGDEDSYVTFGVSGDARSNLEVARLLAAMAGAAIEHVPGEQGPSCIYDLSGAKELGPVRYRLEDTLRRMLDE